MNGTWPVSFDLTDLHLNLKKEEKEKKKGQSQSILPCFRHIMHALPCSGLVQ